MCLNSKSGMADITITNPSSHLWNALAYFRKLILCMDNVGFPVIILYFCYYT